MLTEASIRSSTPEIWGGIECTINRVGDEFYDQLHRAGHYEREDDIAQFAALGFSKIRYPLLWEKHQQSKDEPIDWRCSAKRLNKIREAGMAPVVTLLHHGSGPKFTQLADPAFPSLMADYAAEVANRFPWIEYYTPVNEPLTTARFSGLYGHWYPHRKSERLFFRMLLNQVKAIVLCMERIRLVNPQAKLVQTEDLSHVHSTPALQYQADFENERRWLTYDLLTGKFNRSHFFWNYLLNLGLREEELNFFIENACIPDIVGFNYYVTSERFLDVDVDDYPLHLKGGNGTHEYVDTEAVRKTCAKGLASLLIEAWERYRLPMAVTECHLNCTQDEQLRWLMEMWQSCKSLHQSGVDIRAFTIWALTGAYDWNSLLTRRDDHYEPGIFEITDGKLKKTILTKAVQQLCETGDFQHPLLNTAGWWHSRS